MPSVGLTSQRSSFLSADRRSSGVLTCCHCSSATGMETTDCISVSDACSSSSVPACVGQRSAKSRIISTGSAKMPAGLSPLASGNLYPLDRFGKSPSKKQRVPHFSPGVGIGHHHDASSSGLLRCEYRSEQDWQRADSREWSAELAACALSFGEENGEHDFVLR